MSKPSSLLSPLAFSPRITCLPVIHGSGDFAVEVRRFLLTHPCDCLAVPLPPSFQEPVTVAIGHLPAITAVVQREPPDWSTEFSTDGEPESRAPAASYVPIDPCQPVIAALRFALGEQIPRAFIDLETARFEPVTAALPDAYALKQVTLEKFSAALLPALPRPVGSQAESRVARMGRRLRELEQQYQHIVLVVSLLEWPWIREAYFDVVDDLAQDDAVEDAELYSVKRQTLLFLLGELPFLTAIYEQARNELEDDENLSVDGIKAMLLTARDRYKADLKRQARNISPKLLSTYLQYVRNLSLIERRLTPDLYTLITAAQQIAGDQFAIHLAETAREYLDVEASQYPTLKMAIQRASFPFGETRVMKSRLPGRSMSWRNCRLQPKPMQVHQQEWQRRWNPFRQCSWPPEDFEIEKFCTHVKDAALALLGQDLARSEKFSTSLKDGLDIRETVRNWHTGDLYVKVLPPNRGSLDCVVILFDSPADPRDYPWRVTWHAEHHDESTLALFATDFRQNMVGPGIGLSTYGGCSFYFPPRPVPDIWQDPRFDLMDTLEERLLAAACFHAREKHIAVMSAAPPGPVWRAIAKSYGKKLLHVSLGKFGQEKLQQLRMFHVLNGTQVRSYAANFIRKA